MHLQYFCIKDIVMREYTLNYLFNGEPRTYTFELKQVQLPVHEGAMHLLQLHFGDGENSLIMPSADATPEEILEQAERVGLTRIQVMVRPTDAGLTTTGE
ncbi:hypothetical protein D3C81_55460 [compost metagenome]